MADNIDSIKTKLPILEGDAGVTEDTEGNVYGVAKIEDILVYPKYDVITENWTSPTGYSNYSITIDNNNFIVSSTGGIIKKHDESGSLIFSIDLNSAPVNKIIVDNQSNYIVATGILNTKNPEVIKIDSTGSIVWRVRRKEYASVTSICFDGDGNIIGAERTSNTTITCFKLTPEGEVLDYPSLAYIDSSHASVSDMALDKNGNIYYTIALINYESYSDNRALIKKSGDGSNVLWKHISYKQDVYSVAIDNDYVYSCRGTNKGAPALNKYDLDGNIIWTFYGLNEIGTDIKVRNGYVYIGNTTMIIKLSIDGDLEWIQILPSKKLDVNDNVLVRGTSTSLLCCKENYTEQKIAYLK